MTDRTFPTVFGPVLSRRLGRSLGVDVIPRKLCTLDCVYCEVGRTDKRGFTRKEYLPTDGILADLAGALRVHADLDCITYSGSGEPTLHARLGYLLQRTRDLSSLPIIVLTNGTLLWRPDVRTDLLHADTVCPSLNAVSEDIFRRINRPHPRLTAGLVLEGLRAFRDVFRGKYYLEILFVRGLNDSDEEVEALRAACRMIAPDRIDLNTVVRPPAEAWAHPVPLERLREIRDVLGPTAHVLVQQDLVSSSGEQSVNGDDILSLLERRAMPLIELSASLSAEKSHVEQAIRQLVARQKVHTVIHGGEEYFAVTDTERLNSVEI